jgi:hypothetical protein
MAEYQNKYSDAAASLLRASLGYFNSSIPPELDSYLFSLLEKAHDDLTKMGIALRPGELSDDFDQATYAAWLYRNGPTGSGKTEMLKSIIRNRQVGQALGAEGST